MTPLDVFQWTLAALAAVLATCGGGLALFALYCFVRDELRKFRERQP